ncbi:MAG: efflux RND transporter periplasmic adaptor subunit [Chitinophagaceae bacterium]|jgi:RND family efflux transporter MFP subunit|nr:efflux RND transporter periplasmic adaptor subunit [Chitinophagaceae bacterium]
MLRKFFIIAFVLLIVAAIVFKLAANKKSIDAAKALPPVQNLVTPVNTMVVAVTDFNDSLIKTGTLIPFKEADINAMTSGKLVSVNFNLGSMVSQGQVVANIDDKALQLNLQQAGLNKNKLEKDVKRNDTLYAGNATTLVEIQNTKLNYENAQNQIALLNKQISDNQIKAPISGQIVTKLKEAGEYVSVGTALGHIVDMSSIKVSVLVNEADVYSLKLGQSVSVATDIYPQVYFAGHISFISDKGDGMHNYRVEVTLQNSAAHPLKAGTFAYVNFQRKSSGAAILIPRSSLLSGMQSPKVYVVENNKTVTRNIITGNETGNLIEVRSGLKAGDQVITGGQVNLKEGSPVKAINSNDAIN